MLRQQSLFSERMEEHLNLFQDTQTASSWELARKLAEYRQNRSQRGHLDVESWAWDNDLFVAKPSSAATLGRPQQNILDYQHGKHQTLDLGLGLPSCSHNSNGNATHDLNVGQASHVQRKRLLADEPSAPSFVKENPHHTEQGDGDACLVLKLGGETYAMAEDENGSQNGKRSRVASPGSQSPMCQVDDCQADLSKAKDYHRRHKVCEMHAKAIKAPVGRVMQRFCQQCSRFHLLQEFDEGKRSCRRRLAGHNKRRRKTQTDSTASRSEDEGGGRAAGVVGILNLFYQLQALRSSNQPNGAINDFEWLLRLLSKANSGLSEPNNSYMTAGRTACSTLQHHQPNTKPPSDQLSESQALLAVLASTHPEVLSLLLNNNFTTQREPRREEISVLRMPPGVVAGTLTNQTSQTKKIEEHSPSGNAFSLISPILPSEQLRMLNNDVSSYKAPATSSHTFSVISGNSIERAIPATEKLFQHFVEDRSSAGCSLPEMNGLNYNTVVDMDGPSTVTLLERDAMPHHKASPDHLRPVIDLRKPPPEETSENSDSASDHSSEEDMQDRTGRIVFKLFDRHPGEIPQTLRSQILEWLYQRPTNMESYIRPGCVILTIFLSMNEFVWQELLKDLRLSLKRLMHIGNCDFWNKGWIFVQVGRENAFIVDGKVHANKPLVYSSLPQVVAIHPLAVVAGEETKITIKGRNLSLSGTSIVCAYDGKYEVQKVLFGQSLAGFSSESYQGLDCEQELSFIFRDAFNTIGRCFIEVERHAVGGDFLPIIVADKEVCAEICTLEREIESASARINELQAVEAASKVDTAQRRVEADIRKFIHELGWLFHLKRLQMTCQVPEIYASSKISFDRFKHLLLYAVNRDWCAVLRKLLDLFLTTKLGPIDSVLEVGLLHKAVQRKCRPIVDMLLAYDVSLHDLSGSEALEARNTKEYAASRRQCVFRPDVSGPAGLTPLHVAASMQDAEELVDALTNDSAQVGLEAWNSCRDVTGQTPFAYAVVRGHQSYLNLVEGKLNRYKDVTYTIISIPDTVHVEELESYIRPTTDYQITLPSSSTIDTESEGKKSNDLESCSIEMPAWVNCPPGRSTDIHTSSILRPPCRLCRGPMVTKRISGLRGPAFRPFVLSMVAIAMVCVCVCVLLKGPPHILFVMAPFTWESVRWGYL